MMYDDSCLWRSFLRGGIFIFVIESTMTRYEIDSLMHSCDGLVSLHRSEGFGLPIAEAMALGRAVIATPWPASGLYQRADRSLREL